MDVVRHANEEIAACARAKGLDAVVDAGGEGVEVRPVAGQSVSTEDVLDVCSLEHGIKQVHYTPAEERHLYEATVRQGACLERVGRVDLSPPPSAATWISTKGKAWAPVAEVIGLLDRAGRSSEVDAVRRACPTPR